MKKEIKGIFIVVFLFLNIIILITAQDLIKRFSLVSRKFNMSNSCRIFHLREVEDLPNLSELFPDLKTKIKSSDEINLIMKKSEEKDVIYILDTGYKHCIDFQYTYIGYFKVLSLDDYLKEKKLGYYRVGFLEAPNLDQAQREINYPYRIIHGYPENSDLYFENPGIDNKVKYIFNLTSSKLAGETFFIDDTNQTTKELVNNLLDAGYVEEHAEKISFKDFDYYMSTIGVQYIFFIVLLASLYFIILSYFILANIDNFHIKNILGANYIDLLKDERYFLLIMFFISTFINFIIIKIDKAKILSYKFKLIPIYYFIIFIVLYFILIFIAYLLARRKRP